MNQLSTPRPVTIRGQRTRQRLVEAAERVFGEKGYEAASISDITRTAEVALGTFYVYFPDKKALFVEVVDALGARLKEELAAAIRGQPDRLAVERAGLKAFFAFTSRHRLLYRVVRQAEFVDQACFRRYYQGFAVPYAAQLRAAAAAGEVRPLDAEALAWCLMGIADFLGMRYVLWARGRGLEKAVDAAVEFLRRGMAPDGAAPRVARRASRRSP
jgi:AcrR family transcriptional regulator